MTNRLTRTGKRSSGLIAQLRDEHRFYGRDWTLPGFRAIAVYRFGVWAAARPRSGLAAKIRGRLLDRLYIALARLVRNQHGIELHRTSHIGEHVKFAHQGGIIIHRYATIGDRCLIHQNVTLGNAGRGVGQTEAPVIEDDVELGVGAVVLGKVTVGAGARIGANVVVYTDVPPGATLVANAPRIIFAPSARKGAEGASE